MKTTKQFIESLVNDFFMIFIDVPYIKYNYDVDSNTHTFLVDESILENKLFMEFDNKITNEAWEKNIEGMICFSSSIVLEEIYQFEERVNPFSNNAMLSRIKIENAFFFDNVLEAIRPKEIPSSAEFDVTNEQLLMAA